MSCEEGGPLSGWDILGGFVVMPMIVGGMGVLWWLLAPPTFLVVGIGIGALVTGIIAGILHSRAEARWRWEEAQRDAQTCHLCRTRDQRQGPPTG